MNEDKLRDYLKWTTADLHETRKRLREVEDAAREPIAIIAMNCRFPGGVRSSEDLWQLVVDGVDAMSPLPRDRGWDLTLPGVGPGTHGGFLDGAGDFDAALFGISPREALAMDPQQRLLLEVAWESLERAGIAPMSAKGGKVGVFMGGSPSRYDVLLDADDELGGYIMTGSAGSVLSGRISYALGLEGPAVTVDTACSSSLVALHLAAQSLRAGECELALTGGTTIMSTPGAFVEFERQGGMSGDGRCKAFSDDADGTGWGEGVGVLVLERLSDARRNGHQVLAVVRGSAVNQDGASNGLTAPNGPSQQRVIRQALANARLSPADVDAVEAHGTGTKLGDPIEAQALLATYGQDRPEGQPLWLGSIKSNIGHTQAAAGVAGVMKMVLALRNGLLPRTLHAGTPSSHVDWSEGAVELLDRARPWAPGDHPRRAGVSAFGVSGTNAHVIIEEAPAAEETPESSQEPEKAPGLTLPLVPWLVSAKTAAGLADQARRLAAGTADADAADVGLSLATTRAALEHRAVVLGTDPDTLRAQLTDTLVPVAARGGRTGFVFSGQGGQRVGMGRELAAAFPVFAQALDEVCGHFDGLREVMFGDAEALKNTGWAQPALFAVEVALYRLVESWGVRPDYLVGHSVGELAAAHVAGVLSLADAALLVSARAGLMRALPSGGAMWAVRATADEVTPLLTDGVSLAAVNAPGQVVVSGTREAVEAVAARFTDRQSRWLEVSHAFHSALMDPMLADFGAAAGELTYETPRIPIVSTLTGELNEEFSAAYWVDQVRGTVRFADAVARLKNLGVTRLLELGPDASLVGAVGEASDDTVSAVPLLRRDRPEGPAAVTALARFWAEGGTVDWTAFFAPTEAEVVELPTYAFQHQRYWPDVRQERPATASAADAVFWDAVERGDDELFAAEFGVDAGAPLRETLPALSAWQRRRREREAVDKLRYEVSWTPLQASAVDVSGGGWLIVEPSHTEDAWADALAGELAERGGHVTRLRLGPDDLERPALAARLGEFASHARVVSFLGQDESGPDGVAASAALVQALGDAGVVCPVWSVTTGAVSAGPGDAVTHPVRAGVWGLGRVVALEEPGRWGGLVDVPESVSRDSVGRLAEVLSGGYGDEDEVAVRGGAVLGRRLVPAVARPGEESWSPSGTVLVSGGTGALGARVARWVVERGAEHVVLISRRGLDADGAPELREELTALGAEVDIVACDVAIREDVDPLFARFDISAVVHTAAVLDDGVVDGLTPERVARVWGAKTQGAWNLHHASLARELDAFVLFSSAAGVWGGAGQGAYAAANAALDGLVEYRRSQGLTGSSIGWGPWAEGGMADDATVLARMDRGGVRPLDPATALNALGSASGCVTVADVDWERFVPGMTALRANRLWDEVAPRALTTNAPRTATGALKERFAGLAPAARRTGLMETVRGLAATVLGFEDPTAVGVSAAFRDLGLDSLMAVELRNALTTASGLKLPSTVVFDFPSVEALTDELLSRLFGTEDEAAAPGVLPVPRAVGDDPVVVVGMGCRFPGGADSPEALWRLLAEGTDALGGFPADRGWEQIGLTGGGYTPVGGFVDGVADFDAGLFGISPREALAMDPQQRLLLEVVWESLEQSGVAPSSLRGLPVGVFAGTNGQDYPALLGLTGESGDGYGGTGSSGSVLSGRVSYALGLEGPAVTIDTACSSSLVALHLAAQALRAGECDLALAGGVTIMSTPGAFIEFERQGGLAGDGRCKAFSDDADGTGWGEGVGVLVLERLSDARRKGHQILAVVRGSAVNQDGASNGLTAPNGPSQQRVIRQALATAGLSPAEVDAVEAHGTGTTLGDPIEAQALLATYGQDRPEGQPLWLGSIKSNIGHTQAAAGVAGVMKMILAMRHATLPSTLHVGTPSTHVDWTDGAVALLDRARAWAPGERPRRAGVSAFGVSGTNAHVIIEEPPAAEAAPEAARDSAPAPDLALPLVPWPVSAKTAAGLTDQARRLATATEDVDAADVGLSLATTRAALEHRAVVLGTDTDTLRARLGEPLAPVVARDGLTGFVFSGQGSQRVGMGRELAAAFPVFAQALDEVCAHFDGLRDVMDGDAEALKNTGWAQPALFAVEVALYRLVESWGLRPDFLVGHSVGELAAAHVAGSLSLADACRLVSARATLMAELPPGGVMWAVRATREEVAPLLVDGASVAAVNAPGQVVVSGTREAVEAVATRLIGREGRWLPVSHAFHSPLMDPMLGDFATAAGALTYATPRIPIVSTLTAEPVTEFTAAYWADQVRGTVRFADAITRLKGLGVTRFLELGPDASLVGAVGETDEDAFAVAALSRKQPEPTTAVTSLARLW
ncbi:type I polyketide synthase, partial [Streptomyces sp. NPDC002530]